MHLQNSITVIVSAFNEEDNLANAINSVISALKLHPNLDYEIIVINDGSSDGTERVAIEIVQKNQKVKLISHDKNLGLGEVVQTGIKAATKKYFMLYAGDDEAGVEGIAPLLALVGQFDLLVPYPINNHIRGVKRAMISRTFTLTVGYLSGIKLNYFNGSVVYKLDEIKSANVKTSGFGYQAKVLVKLVSAGVKYTQVPIKLNEISKGNSTKAFKFRNILSVIKTLFEIFALRCGFKY